MSRGELAIIAALVCGATVLAVVVGDGSLPLAVAPALLLAVLYATWRLPLRWPLLALTFLALTLENPSDVPAEGLWKSPLYTAGALLLAHLNVTIHHKALLFSGLDLALLFMGIVVGVRVARHERLDGAGVPGARPMRAFALLTLAGVAWMWVYGVVAAGGADVASSLWQVQRVVYLPIVFLLFSFALRGPRDYAALGKVLVVAACTKACVALYVSATVTPPAGHATLQYATTHADSMLFADAACLVLVLALQRYERWRVVLAVVALPLLVAGMVANNRRLVWVEVVVGLLVVFGVMRRTRLKLAVLRATVLVSPALVAYGVVGWGSGASVFRPVQVIRSLVDSSADPSTTWRDWENYDLFYTIRQHPLLGTGYGHGYIELAKLPDISSVYSLYRFIPHNGVLGLWAYGGIVGFTAIWTMYAVGVFFAARAYEHAKTTTDRTAALGSLIAIVVYLAHCYGDMGLGTWVGVFTVAPALAVGAKLAVTTGAWSDEAPARKVVPVGATAREVAT